jgi:UDP-N-acetylglucosamine acyltransferase
MKISSHAVIDPGAQLASDVEVGPFCVIGAGVKIDSGTRLLNSVTILGPTTIGKNNEIHPYVAIGGAPQDIKYCGAPTQLHIGDGNIIREGVTIHRGTEKGGGITRVGNGNYLMCNVHIGHDVQFGSGCTLANSVMIAGHVIIHDKVAMGGGVGIHQFVTVGEYCFIGGCSRIHKDVPPFMRVDGADLVRGVNVKLLKGSGFSDQDIEQIEDACRRLFYRRDDLPFAMAMEEYKDLNGVSPHIKRLVEFLRLRGMGKHGRYLETMRKA